jgi:hypothetical protein
VPPVVVPVPDVEGLPQPERCADPVVPLDPLGTVVDCPGVGAGAGPVPFGIRVSVEPGTEFWGVLVEVPGAPEVAPPEPVLPELPDEPPDEPPCPKASEA